MKKRRNLTQSFIIRVSPEFLAIVRRAAGEAGVPLSRWMRGRLLRAAGAELAAAGRLAEGEAMRAAEREGRQPGLFGKEAFGKEPFGGEGFGEGLLGEESAREAARRLARLRRELRVAATKEGVCEVRMRPGGAKAPAARSPKAARPSGKKEDAALARAARAQIEAYLDGRLREFTLPVDLSALTPFTRRALRAAQRIPYGETRTYAWVARQAGSPRAARAVGQALHRNPVSLFVP